MNHDCRPFTLARHIQGPVEDKLQDSSYANTSGKYVASHVDET